MKYLAQIVFIQILWHQFYKLYNNNLNANIFIQIIFLSMKLNVHWNHPLWLNTPFTFCDSPIEIIPSSRRVPINLKRQKMLVEYFLSAARKNVPHKAVFLTIQKLKETRNAKNCWTFCFKQTYWIIKKILLIQKSSTYSIPFQ